MWVVSAARAASSAVGSSLTMRGSRARVKSARAGGRLPFTAAVSWKKIVSYLYCSASCVRWTYSRKSMSVVVTASGWRQPARWLPGVLRNAPSLSCLRSVIGGRPGGEEGVGRHGHAQIGPQGGAVVLGAEDAAALQLRHHQVDELLERLGVVREQQVEAVARAGLEPGLHVVGELARRPVGDAVALRHAEHAADLADRHAALAHGDDHLLARARGVARRQLGQRPVGIVLPDVEPAGQARDRRQAELVVDDPAQLLVFLARLALAAADDRHQAG